MNYEGIMYIRYIPNIHNMHDLKYRHIMSLIYYGYIIHINMIIYTINIK
jgi:hypothetical protein